MLTVTWTENEAQAPTVRLHRQTGASGKSEVMERRPEELVNKARSAADGGASSAA